MIRAGEIRTVTMLGRTFKASRRTIWHLRWTIWLLALRFPKARLNIIQTCYNTDPRFRLSAGTHDFDCVFDVWITGGVLGSDPWRAQRFLRACGWAAFFRHTGTWAARSAWHIHMVSLPPGLPAHPTALDVGKAYAALGIKVGEFIDGGYTTQGRIVGSSQVVDYYRHDDALADHAADPSWHPKYINKSVFRRSWWFNRVSR